MATRTAERTEFLQDIISCAIEGGINDWARTSHYQYVYNGERCICVATSGYDDERHDAYAIVHPLNDDESGYEKEGKEINIDVIAAGLARIISGKENVHASYIQRIKEADKDNDAGEIDAYDASMIVQAGLLGEVIYG